MVSFRHLSPVMSPLSLLTSCTLNKTNLSRTTYLATNLGDSDLCRVLTLHVQVKKHHSKSKAFDMVRNVARFYVKELLGSRSTSKLEDHHLSVVLDCVLNIFAATLHL